MLLKHILQQFQLLTFGPSTRGCGTASRLLMISGSGTLLPRTIAVVYSSRSTCRHSKPEMDGAACRQDRGVQAAVPISALQMLLLLFLGNTPSHPVHASA
jgi:hypothetical protein